MQTWPEVRGRANAHSAGCLAIAILSWTLQSHAQPTSLPQIAFLVALRAQAASGSTSINGIYRGTLGKQEIVVEIGEDREARQAGSVVTGRYFFRHRGAAIFFEGGRLKDGSIRLKEFVYRDDESRALTGGEWRISFSGEQGSGYFCKCDVSKSPTVAGGDFDISVKRVAADIDPAYGYPPAGDPEKDPVYYKLLLDYSLKSDPEVRISAAIAYVMQTDARFKVSAPQLTRFPDTKMMAEVNGDLAVRFRDGRLKSAACMQNVQGGVEEHYAVTLLTRDLLNVVQGTVSFCGGMHSENTQGILTYDMHTGDIVDFQAMLKKQIDPEVLKKYEDSNNMFPCIKNCDPDDEPFRGLLVELYMRYYISRPEAKDENCKVTMFPDRTGDRLYHNSDIWPARNGLVIQPVLQHATQGCGPEINIPYSEIFPLLKKDSALLALLPGAPVAEKKSIEKKK